MGEGLGRGVKNFEERFPCKGTLGESSPLKRLGLLVTCYYDLLIYISYFDVF